MPYITSTSFGASLHLYYIMFVFYWYFRCIRVGRCIRSSVLGESVSGSEQCISEQCISEQCISEQCIDVSEREGGGVSERSVSEECIGVSGRDTNTDTPTH